jgi:hypothetical protein
VAGGLRLDGFVVVPAKRHAAVLGIAQHRLRIDDSDPYGEKSQARLKSLGQKRVTSKENALNDESSTDDEWTIRKLEETRFEFLLDILLDLTMDLTLSSVHR